MKQTSKQRSKKNKEINKWKWAFLLFVSFLLLLVFFFIRMLQPISIQETEEVEIEERGEIEIKSGITKEDAEFVMNSYLKTQTRDEKTSYQVKIDDELEFSSAIKLMGLEIPLKLVFEAYATEDGNLQLRADSMNLASLSLPVSAVLSVLANQMDLPEYIQLDSKEKIILVNFNELRDYYPYGIELDKIDLENNDIQLKLFVNKVTLIRALDFEKEIQSNSKEKNTED